ncbi:MAG: ABC transporter substrate-binding protein [Defluviitaleaceae bacterium]|nr:ABC transporter substrate-binding protein [Defluviitaleaceae bacterium]
MKKDYVKMLSVLFVSVLLLGACVSGAGQAVNVGNEDATVALDVNSGNSSYEPDETQSAVSVGVSGTPDELVIVVPSMPVSLDPIGSNDNGSVLVRNNIFDSLIHLNPATQQMEPGLAIYWDMPDAWTVNAELRRGVYFHNGDYFTASDVRFTFERLAEAPLTRAIVAMIEFVEVHDDYNVTFHLNEPFVPILNILAANSSRIVSESAALELGDAFHESPVGTGPFKLDYVVLGDRVVLTQNDNFWGGAPQLSRITYRVVAEQANRFIEVETGSADIAMQIAPTDIARAEATEGLALHRGQSFSYTYIGFNVMNGPLADARVRHAINHALDTQAIVEAAFAGTGSLANGPLSPLSAFTTELEPFEFDVELARDLMVQAGYADGFSVSLLTNAGNQARADVAEIVQNQLRAINIEVVISIYEHALFLERTAAGDHDMFVFGTTAANPDPNTLLYSMFHTDMAGGPGNRMFYSNPEVDRLLDEGRAQLDPDIRKIMYADAQRTIRDDAPQVFLHQGEELHLSRANVRNFSATANGVQWFWQVTFED